ncbi:ankyrin repeat and SOCS box protein 2-like [Xyrichtys novacula]|nr:ankyrin repeat and SOCS box protein 2-like [Xyrichtys novacula]
MEAALGNHDHFCISGHMTDEELVHVAVERSFDDARLPNNCQHTLSVLPSGPSSALSAPSSLLQPGRQTSIPSRNISDPPHTCATPSPAQLSIHPPPQVPNNANPPTALSQFLYRGFERKLSPVESLIVNGDTDSLKNLVRQESSILMEPDDGGWVALHEAAYYGHLPSVRILIDAYPDSLNKRSLRNQTPLLLAASQGQVACVDFFLKRGADPNIPEKDGETPLFTACDNLNCAVVDLLLRSGAQVNRCSVRGFSPLHEGCRHGNVELCKMLLEAGAHLETKNIYGITPFFTAAQHGHVDTLRLLAKKGADINKQALDGASPLFEACKNGHIAAVELLLALKADANRSLMSGLLPLHVAVQNNHIRVVTMLIPVTSRVRIRNCGISPLHIAADKNRDDIMELLIESGFDVNAQLSEGNSKMYEDRRSTALYFSVYNGNFEATEMLLEAGANPNLDVFNPLLIAVRLGRIDMASILLKYGANVNAQISTQPSVFPSALLLRIESLPMLKLLLDNGCDAWPCFYCSYNQQPHPPIMSTCRLTERLQASEDTQPLRPVQFCEVVSSPSFSRVNGPLVNMLLDYVDHVRLCSRLLEFLEMCSEWEEIKLKAAPPRPLMHLCRLKIRHLIGAQRLQLLHTLPLPGLLIRFLCHDITYSPL